MSTYPSSNPALKGVPKASSDNSEGEENLRLHQSAGLAVPANGKPLPPRVLQQDLGKIRRQIKCIEGNLRALAQYVEALGHQTTTFDESSIIAAVCREWRVQPSHLTEVCRSYTYTEPRRAAQFLIRKHLRLSLPEIGRKFKQHHSTVLNGIEVFRDFYSQDSLLRSRVQSVEVALGLTEPIQ